jgi:hypothetical protein
LVLGFRRQVQHLMSTNVGIRSQVHQGAITRA